MSDRKLRIAIVGGGVCGLTCAVALLREGVDVHVYEAASKFGEIGAGIGLGRNAMEVLTALGVYDDILARVRQANAIMPSGTSEENPNGGDGNDMRGWFKYVSGMPGHKMVYDYELEGNNAMGVHRATFLDALVHHVDPARAHFHKRCTHITHSADGDTTIHFQDGTTATADVVLGADGIKSAVRRFVAGTSGQDVDPNIKFSRTRCYRALIPAEKAAAAGVKTDFRARPTCFVGENKHLIIFTIRGGTVINVVAFSADSDSDPEHYPSPSTEAVQQVSVEEVLAAYDGWGPEVRNLLSCAVNPTKWSINVVYPPIPPERWARGPVAILGDAAHGMLPHLGSGAGQGIEDAYVLGKLLSHPQTTPGNVEEVLKAYATIRQPRAQRVWEGSRRAGDIYDLRASGEGMLFEELLPMMTYVWSYPLNEAFEEAAASLTSKGTFKVSS
ncbi:uncharacterized protein PHACADRAFT_248683 [Phanerochaete carnosa HHB-10118-sp]|uniref:FAD-binding domain-containing protein n=1 Tax=Phanerochaete carnosa (strain HHB-10118-sp) TaxID=650164 RepID=K5VFN7_PHACS|nr:uncharacterized protein PHACADRAFT_248683 [Phanerochaete carnosa HHB-10118-sp]EKM61811.1 hypothetical protein PHACADRAFT_248683 [Phanerochaete carnosa HHB-10118-sp]